jgi:DNA polymerase beta
MSSNERKRKLAPEDAEQESTTALPKPKELKKKLKTHTTEIQAQPHPNYNKQLTDVLEEMEKIEANRGDIHRARAYQKAVRALKNHATKVTSGAEARRLDGVGAKTAAKIDEILSTGRLVRLEDELKDENTRAINELCRISGVGPAAAKKFVDDGVKTIDALRERWNELTNHQQIGLKYLTEFEQRIPRKEMEAIERKVQNALRNVDPELIGEVQTK